MHTFLFDNLVGRFLSINWWVGGRRASVDDGARGRALLSVSYVYMERRMDVRGCNVDNPLRYLQYPTCLPLFGDKDETPETGCYLLTRRIGMQRLHGLTCYHVTKPAPDCDSTAYHGMVACHRGRTTYRGLMTCHDRMSRREAVAWHAIMTPCG